MSQPDGSYPRLNAALLRSGKYSEMIVSLVGRVKGSNGTQVSFECADGEIVQVSTEHGEIPPGLPADAVVEIVGQVLSPNDVAVSQMCAFRRNSVFALAYLKWIHCCCSSSFLPYLTLASSPLIWKFLQQLFVVRELSSDTNMEIYNKMLMVQTNPKFAHYFAPLDGTGMGSPMATN